MRTGTRPRIAAGQLDREVTIRTRTSAPDGGGGYEEGDPVDVDTVWASVEPLAGNEQLVAMQTGIQRPHRFTLRYRADVDAITQLVYAGRTFDVKNVVDTEEKHREIVILADELMS